jgi:DNA-binding FadR family transcriptional regulator
MARSCRARYVSREVKRRVLRDLERAGLIMVERRHGKTTIVTPIAD